MKHMGCDSSGFSVLDHQSRDADCSFDVPEEAEVCVDLRSSLDRASEAVGFGRKKLYPRPEVGSRSTGRGHWSIHIDPRSMRGRPRGDPKLNQKSLTSLIHKQGYGRSVFAIVPANDNSSPPSYSFDPEIQFRCRYRRFLTNGFSKPFCEFAFQGNSGILQHGLLQK